MTIKLHGFPNSRSNRVRWMLEEVGETYEFIHVDLLKGGQKQPDYLALHPHGRVPYFEDGNVVILESAAAVLYLGDKHPEKKLAPAVGSPDRGAYYSWVVYAASTLDKACVDTFFHTVLLPAEARKAEIVADHKPTLQAAMRVLENALKGKSYLVGDAFSGADIAVGYSLNLAEKSGAVVDAPNVTAYIARLRERPAFKKVYG